MTLSHPGYRLAAIPALLVAGLAASPAARPVVDGWSFTSTTKSTDRSVGETTMQVRLAGANVRVDWVKAPQGMPRDGYMLLNADSAILKMVSPREKTVTILPVGGMASMLGAIGAAGMMKMEVSDVVVSVSDDGAGEDLLGYRTRKYTMKQAYGLKMSVGPIKRSQTIDNTTELWVADVPAPEQKAFEAFAKNFAQSLTGAGFGGDGMKALLDEVAAKMPRGATLKSVATVITTDGGRKNTSTTTTEVKEFRQGPIEASVFEIPAGYKVTDMMSIMNK